ncbi:MAG TPA: hypothetical protein PLN24_03255 [Victivallales bacterium]|nr:hypothetical protein [Victivallales bacterium]
MKKAIIGTLIGTMSMFFIGLNCIGDEIFNIDFAKGDFKKFDLQVEGDWDIHDYKAANNNPGLVARFPANKAPGKIVKKFPELKDPKQLKLSIGIGWGWGNADQGADVIEFALLNEEGNGYVFHIRRVNANWAIQWATVENNAIPKDKNWAPEAINCNQPAIIDGGGLENLLITREKGGKWTIFCQKWNNGQGGTVKFEDKTTTSFNQVVLFGTNNFDEQAFNNIILEVNK